MGWNVSKNPYKLFPMLKNDGTPKMDGDKQVFILNTYPSGRARGVAPEVFRPFTTRTNIAVGEYSHKGKRKNIVSHEIVGTPEELLALKTTKGIVIKDRVSELEVADLDAMKKSKQELKNSVLDLGLHVDIKEVNPEEQIELRNGKTKKIPASKIAKANDVDVPRITRPVLVRRSEAKKYGIQIDTVETGIYAREIEKIFTQDVIDFADGWLPKKEVPEFRLTTGQDLEREPVIKPYIPKPTQFILEGKAFYHDKCWKHIGIELSADCIAYMNPDGTYDPTSGCGDCYAGWRNKGPISEKLFDISKKYFVDSYKKQISKMPIRENSSVHVGDLNKIVNRLGQNVEFFMPDWFKKWKGYVDSETNVLEGMHELKEFYEGQGKEFKTILVSRTLKYDSRMHDLLAPLDPVVLYSVAPEGIDEHWSVEFNSSIDDRLEESVKFADAGFKTGLFVMIDMSRDPKYMHANAKKAVGHRLQHPNVGIQWLEARIESKEFAQVIGGAPWDFLTGKRALPEELDKYLGVTPGSWKYQRKELVVKKIHKYYRDVAKNFEALVNGESTCSSYNVDPKEHLCGACFLKSDYNSVPLSSANNLIK